MIPFKTQTLKKTLLTGDRPTGPLHLGHYVGSLQTRIKLQKDYECFVMIADLQALTDHISEPQKIKAHILQVMRDYVSVGLDPENITFFVQSQVPALYELTFYLMNFVTLGRLERNPTVKEEIKQKNMQDSLPMGFFCYPVSQAADILAFASDVVPVGADQLPLIEITNDIARRFNQTYDVQALKSCEPLLSPYPRLIGLDGKAKASKSLNNAVFLKDDDDVLKKKVFSMFTDPNHLKISDPGRVEGNVVFSYLDAFYEDKEHLNELKAHYARGGLGDTTIKNLLLDTLKEFLIPIRERKDTYRDSDLRDILQKGNLKARQTAEHTVEKLREILCLN